MWGRFHDHPNHPTEIEALIQQRLTSGAFRDVEDVLLRALCSSEPETQPVTGPTDAGRSIFEQGLGLFGSPDDAALLVMHVPEWVGSQADLFRSAEIDLVGGAEIAAHARAFTTGVLAVTYAAVGAAGTTSTGGRRADRSLRCLQDQCH